MEPSPSRSQRSGNPSRLGLRRAGLAALVLIVGLAIFSQVRPMAAADRSQGPRHPIPPAEGGSWVVVELFTSQGCSSCPSADRLLAPLADGRLAGPGVLPLAFHVDYWDYIGWEDPFASSIWTDRQRDYARETFETNRIYTPQAVVQGAADCVGSNRSCLEDAIREARLATSKVEFGGSANSVGEVLEVKIQARSAPKREATEQPRIWLALYEIGLRTPIGAGENSGRQLDENFVVRRLVDLGSMTQVGPEGAFEAKTRLEVDASWKRANLGVVALAQQGQGGPIVGSALIAAGL